MRPADDDQLVADLQAAHHATVESAEQLAEARQRRRKLAGQLHSAGRSYRWIGEQIGVTAQAVEGFLKYRQRHNRNEEVNHD